MKFFWKKNKEKTNNSKQQTIFWIYDKIIYILLITLISLNLILYKKDLIEYSKKTDLWNQIEILSNLAFNKIWNQLQNNVKKYFWISKHYITIGINYIENKIWISTNTEISKNQTSRFEQNFDISQINPFVLKIPTQKLKEIYENSKTYRSFYNNIRKIYLKQLVQNWFSWFISQPYKNTKDNFPMTNSWYKLLKVKNIYKSDALDVLLGQKLSKYKILYKDLFISWYYQNIFLIKWRPLFIQDLEIIPPQNFSWVFLFKDKQDLQDLWYKIVSYRYRKSVDKYYRRQNIKTAFEKIWKVFVLNPWQTFSYLNNIDLDIKERKNYLVGQVVKDNKIIYEYWWWLCWWSTAIYQWILTNKWFKILDWRNHTLRVTTLYWANINWNYITTPWLDATIYEWSQDLKFQNQTNHPLIFVMEFDWQYWHHEINFSMWFDSDKWYYKYISRKFLPNTKCYTWNINWELKTACYKIKLNPKKEIDSVN